LATVPIIFIGTPSGASRINISCLNGKKYVQNGENVSLNCWFSSDDVEVTAWFKQTPGEKPLLIASAYRLSATVYHNGFDKSGRFTAVTEKDIFTLNISNTEASDSATYFCAVAYYTDIALLDCTVVVLKDAPSSLYTVLQPPVSDPVQLGGDTTLQCSILTDNSAGDHSVYWFRHGSGESDPGIIFTHGNRSDQCKKSSETVSPTQSCIYKLPKNNLSLSDAGTYYCAVAACGHIFFGNGTKLDLTGEMYVFFLSLIIANRDLDPTTMVSAALNIILMLAVLFLCRQLHSSHQKGNFTLNFKFSKIKMDV
uniref:Ig-like domain-containing protein n=1 Tax=Astyanax mexicanus TaxID=7994 RepID=A0A3B1JHS5_ASTMX